MRKIPRTLGTAALAGALLAAVALVPLSVLGAVAGTVGEAWNEMPADLKINPSPQRTEVYASDGKTLIAIFYDENRKDVALTKVSIHMKNALIAAEDEDFYQHHGYSLKGILRALVSNQRGGSTQGASTITQQYVRQALTYYATSPKDIVKATEDTPARKMREIRYATALENKFTKDQILELYLNIAYFGHGAYGISAASQVYFNKTPDKLNIPEASLLAGLVKAPSTFDPAVKSKRPAALGRREYVLSQMVKATFITQVEADKAQKSKLVYYGKQTREGCTQTYQIKEMGSGFFCDYLRRWWQDNKAFGKNTYEREMRLVQGGYKIISSLDVSTQKAAHKYVKNAGNKFAGLPVTSKYADMQVGVEPGTGRVLTMAVNRNFSNAKGKGNTTNPLLSGSSTIHGYQFGSTFKLFTSVAAIQKGISPNKKLSVPHQAVTKYIVSSGDCRPYYCVTNSNPSFQDIGSANLYEAFGRSINTVYVPLQASIGSRSAIEMAKKMGISFSAHGTKSRPADYEFSHDKELENSWGPFTLGVSQTTSLEMSSAYATIAANGKYCKPIPVISIIDRNGIKTDVKTQCTQVITPKVSAKMLDVARCPVGGTPKYGKCNGATFKEGREIVGSNVFGKSGTTDGAKSVAMIMGTNKLVIAGIITDPEAPLRHHSSLDHPAVNLAVAYTLRDSGR